MFRLSSLVVVSCCFAAQALAGGPDGRAPDARALIGPQIIEAVQQAVASELVGMSLNGANEDRAGLSQREINALDARWREERDRDQQPLVAGVLAAPLSAYLTRIQARSAGLYTEIIVVGRKGLNVGQSSVTSDMWQGDEDKFIRTYGVGPGAVFIDAAEWHAPTATWRAQLNFTVDNPTGGRPLGAATFEINLTELSRRMEASQ